MSYLLQILVEMVGYTVARFVLPLISAGKVYVEPFTVPSGKFNLLGYRRDESGRIVIDSTTAGSLGLVICLIVAFVFALLIRGL